MSTVDIWIEAVGMIDEDIIDEFIEKDMELTERKGAAPQKRKNALAWVAYSAACLGACAAVALVIYLSAMWGRGQPDVPKPPIDPLGSSSTPSESSPDESPPDESPEETTPPLPDNDNIGDPSYSDEYVGDLVFELTEDGIYYTVTSCKNAPADIVLPEIYMGKYVTGIADNAFSNHRNLNSITIPDTVMRIGDKAFLNCYQLTSIDLPELLMEIGNNAFEGCKALTSLAVPEYLSDIGDKAFLNCTALESVSFSGSLRSIGDNAFENCDKITEVILPDGFESMGEKAFLGCGNITKLSVPESIRYWGDQAFETSKLRVYKNIDGIFYAGNENNECLLAVALRYKSTENIVIADGCKVIASMGFSNASVCKSVYIPKSVSYIGDGAFKRLEKLTTVVIDGGSLLQEIGDSAFEGCKELSSINLQEGLVRIGDYAFKECAALLSIDLPDSVTEIGREAFAYCSGLTEFRCPESLEAIPEKMLSWARSIERVYFSSSIKSVGAHAFECTRLIEIIVPGTVKTVEDSAFGNIPNLKRLVFSEGVQYIGESVFDSCSNLEEVVFPSSLEYVESLNIGFGGMISLPYQRYENGAYLGNGENKYVMFLNIYEKDLVEITLAPSCRIVYADAFKRCASTLTKVVLPEGLVQIGEEAFADCTLLENVNIPSTVKYIGRAAFFCCDSLKVLVIPEGVEEICEEAFSGVQLESLTLPSTIKKISNGALSYATNITFGGTAEEWMAIVASSKNRGVLEKCTVTCSDGVVMPTQD